MNKGYKLFAAFLTALMLMGVTARASRTQMLPMQRNLVADNDTTKTSTNDNNDIPETSIVDEVIWVVGRAYPQI